MLAWHIVNKNVPINDAWFLRGYSANFLPNLEQAKIQTASTQSVVEAMN
jgi:hypothetical protein